MVLNTLPSMSKINVATDTKNPSQVLDSTFSWAAFLQLIPNLKVRSLTAKQALSNALSLQVTNLAHMDLLDCVVDLMAVDILTAVLQHYEGLSTVSSSSESSLLR